MSEELKPCPCCGGSALFEDDGDGGNYIECKNIGCGITTNLRYAHGDDPKPLLADVWNRRAQPEPAAAADATEDELLDLEQALERRRILEEIKKVAEVHPADDMPTPFQSAWQQCCEEIFYRATEGQWHMDEDASRFAKNHAAPEPRQPMSACPHGVPHRWSCGECDTGVEMLERADAAPLVAPEPLAFDSGQVLAILGAAHPPRAPLPETLHTFLNAAAGEGLVLDGVDAADLYIALFPERYAAGVNSIDSGVAK